MVVMYGGSCVIEDAWELATACAAGFVYFHVSLA